MAKTNTIITIGREFGSGGHDIGCKLAEDLDIKLYDKEMLDRAAKESGICQELFESQDEKPTNSFLYSLVMDTYSFGGYSAGFTEMPLNHKIFLAQFDTIKNIANEGPCVLVGRCADYVLEDYKNVLRVFIHADLDDRIARVARLYDITNAKAKEMIHKTDKQRASYYNYYSNKRWSDAQSYDVCLNSSILGIDGTVEAIERLIEIREKNYGVKL
jgi:cytidylate kinase